MAYKITKREIKEMSNVQLLISFEQCNIAYEQETCTVKGVTKTTAQSYIWLKDALLDALGCDQTYDYNYNIIDRNQKK